MGARRAEAAEGVAGGAGADGGLVVTRVPLLLRGQGPVLAVVALGGVMGAAARYGASLLWPTAHGTFPWTTFGVNAVGCALMGVLMVVITEGRQAHPLVRPFLGTGVLGGFTTFSTYAVDIERLTASGEVRTALAYLALTPVAALAAVWAGSAATRRATAAAVAVAASRRRR
ncbi:fluoride efflux transporter CrcB [Streptomyces himalayensis]|uniref:Fluoride-specific ion channel FluC n=1 Tax=Streptomyces himalayensis subsp. himalayensis TaxID=2756131 RepID=A0A7W0I7R5_9ACTN|nr:fluoride efflux transporter CrcB [Streptomyces himalayensis]MBA2945276.1 fluoride efflux transporter CrcB [Streptomyces himalayensis subsp. himalayensis]